MHLHLNVLTRFAHALPINCKTYWTNSSLSEFKWLCEKSARCKNVCVFFHHLKLPPRSRVNHSSWLRDYISSFFLQPSEPHGSIGREQKVGKWVHCSAGGIGDFPAKAENYPIPINPSNQKFPMAIFKTIGRNLGWEKRERGDTVAFFCKWKFPTERHNFPFSENERDGDSSNMPFIMARERMCTTAKVGGENVLIFYPNLQNCQGLSCCLVIRLLCNKNLLL